jgi:hypothetical protein
MDDDEPSPSSQSPPVKRPATIGGFLRSFTNRSRSQTSAAERTPGATASDRLSSLLAAQRRSADARRSLSVGGSTVPYHVSGFSSAFGGEIGPYDASPYEVFVESVTQARTTKQRVEAVGRLAAAVKFYDTADPIQTWLSCSFMLSSSEPSDIRLAAFDLLLNCSVVLVDEDPASYTPADRAVLFEAAQSYFLRSEDMSVAELEALTKVLDALTKGGRDVSAYPGVIDLVCSAALRLFKKLQSERDVIVGSDAGKTPLTDPSFSTPFVRIQRPTQSKRDSSIPSTSPLALLTAIHKFSYPHITPSALARAAQTVIAVALATSSETDIEAGLNYVDVVIRFGYVPSEHLRDVVGFVARIAGLAQRANVFDWLSPAAKSSTRRPGTGITIPLPPTLPDNALAIMRNLLRSPANQVLRHLRESLAGPSFGSTTCDVPLIVGSLRCLRHALNEYERNASSSAAVPIETGFGGAKGVEGYPSVLGMGLSFLFDGLCSATQWRSAVVDVEVLSIVDDRLVNKLSPDSIGSSSSSSPVDSHHHTSSIDFELWDMALEILDRTKWHLDAWEEKNQRAWVLDFSSIEPNCAFLFFQFYFYVHRRWLIHFLKRPLRQIVCQFQTKIQVGRSAVRKLKISHRACFQWRSSHQYLVE